MSNIIKAAAGHKFVFNDIDLEKIGSQGYGYAAFRVAGYWSENHITLYICRRRVKLTSSPNHPGVWEFIVSNSAGGRDNNAVVCDLEATRNYGAAMLEVANLGLRIQMKVGLLERCYKEAEGEREAQCATTCAARQALVDADPPIGAEAARQLVASVVKLVKANLGEACVVSMYDRGEFKTTTKMTFVCNKQTKMTNVHYMGARISAAKAAEILTDKASQRTSTN